MQGKDLDKRRMEATKKVPQDSKADSGMLTLDLSSVNVLNTYADTSNVLELEILEKSQVILEPIKNLGLQIFQIPTSQMAGRLKNHMENWLKITSDQIILRYVEGIEINFFSTPFQLNIPRNIVLNCKEMNLLSQEILEMKNKGVIIEVPPCKHQFISNLFISMFLNCMIMINFLVTLQSLMQL